jgi:hypothetical protein
VCEGRGETPPGREEVRLQTVVILAASARPRAARPAYFIGE